MDNEYKNAFCRAKSAYGTGAYDDATIEFLFPQLAKSEDDKAYNELADHIKEEFEGFRTLLKKKGIDYEPQRGYWVSFARLFVSSAKKYSNPVEWSEEDEKAVVQLLEILDRREFLVSDDSAWLSRRLKSLRSFPRWRPTNEQIGMVTRVCNGLHMRNSSEAEGMSILLKQLEKLYWGCGVFGRLR